MTAPAVATPIRGWRKNYPEFRREFEEAVLFRNDCWMDDCVDIADDVASGLSTAERKLCCDMRWKQLRSTGLKAVAPRPDNSKPKIVERDPVHALLYQWEIEFQKRQRA